MNVVLFIDGTWNAGVGDPQSDSGPTNVRQLYDRVDENGQQTRGYLPGIGDPLRSRVTSRLFNLSQMVSASPRTDLRLTSCPETALMSAIIPCVSQTCLYVLVVGRMRSGSM